MRKNNCLMPIFSIVAGIVGMILRKKELATIFDSATGLAERGATVTILLGILSAVVVLISILYAVIGCKNGKAEEPYEVIMSPRSPLGLLLQFVSGAAIIVGGILYFFAAKAEGVGGTYTLAFAVLAIATGVCQFVLSAASYRKKKTEGMGIAVVVAPLYLCMWLVATYRNFGTEPSLLRFCGMCIALIFATLSFYYTAGFAFGKKKLKRTVAANLIAIYMCIVLMADFVSLSTRMILGGLVIIMCVNVTSLVINSHKKKRVK